MRHVARYAPRAPHLHVPAMTPELAELAAHYDAMPPVRALEVRPRAWDGERLRVHAPLAANVNDKACAFGGSLAGVMTLAGWGLLTLKARAAGLVAEVYVADSQLRYLAPLYDDLEAEASLAPGQDWDAIEAQFRARGKARVEVEAVIRRPDGASASTLQARFALMAPKA